MAWRGVVLSGLVACGGGGGKAARPTTAITAAGDQICPSITEVEVALESGCPRQALGLLSGKTGIEASFLRTEARADALGESFDRSGHWGPVVDATWAGPVGDAMETLDPFAVAEDDKRLPVRFSESGRFARLVVRASPDPTCLAPSPRNEIDTVFDQVVSGMFARYRSRMPGRAGILHAEGLAVRRSCGRETERLDDAVKAYAAAGQREAAFEARLDAIEVAFFPAGRALELDLAPYAPRVALEHAALEEAAALCGGTLYQQGVAADDALAEVKATSGPIRARIAVLRAVAALRLKLDTRSARAYATEAETLALAAKRADLVDQARVVLLFAAAAEQRWADFEALVEAVERSFEARGALGARRTLARKIAALTSIDRLRGRHDHAIELLARASPRLQAKLPAVYALELASELASVLASSGRFEAAAEAAASLEQLFAKRRGEIPAASVPIYAHFIDGIRRQVAVADQEGNLGFSDKAREMEGAFRTGDEAAIEAIRQRPTDLTGAASRDLLLARYGTACHLVGGERLAWIGRELKPHVEGLAARYRAGDTSHSEDLLTFQQLAAGHALLYANCAAVLRMPELIELGRAIVRAESALLGDADPILEKLFDAAKLEADGNPRAASPRYVEAAHTMSARMGTSAEGATGAQDILSVFYRRAIASALKAGDPQAAIGAIEESTAKDLRIQRSLAAAGDAAITDKVVALERAIDQARARERTLANLAASRDTSVRAALAKEVAALEQKIAELQKSYDGAVRELQRQDSGAYQRAALAPTPNVASLASRLGPDESLIYAAIGDEEAWLVVVERDGPPRIVELDRRTAWAVRRFRTLFARRVATGRGAVEVESSTGPAALAPDVEAARVRLGKLLVEPLERVARKPRWLFVPDALTTLLPLASLDGRDGPIIASHAIRILPGAHMLPEVRPADGARKTALVVGGVEFGSDGQARQRGKAEGAVWQNLPGTRAEADSVGKLYGTAVLGGRDATEREIRARMAGVDVIHLATHGLAETRRPADSTLVFALPRSGEPDDGFLRAREIERQHVKADLVVLSACETGGDVKSSQGSFGLDRAFLVAGAGAVVSSLWVVNDAATAALMQAFHEHVRRGAGADLALAQAMSVVRSNPKWRDPYYWAAFRVVGAGARGSVVKGGM